MFKKILVIFALLSGSIAFAQNSSINEMNLKPLSAEDVDTYRTIFYEQNRGRWKQADKGIKKIAVAEH